MPKKVFIHYAPLFLLLPMSLAVGLYVVEKFDLLYAAQNRFYFYYYIALAAAPLYFVFVRAKTDLGEEILEIFTRFVGRFAAHKWIYASSVVAVSILFLMTANSHISTYTERDRWIFEDDIPIVPIDMPILLRMAWALNRFLPMDLSVPVLGLFAMLLWLAFLIHVHGGEGKQGYLALLVFALTFMNKSFFELLYANFELPSALLGWMGLYAIWRRRINLGLFFVVLSTVWKNTGLFQLMAAAVLLVFILFQDRARKEDLLKKFNIPFLIFLILYFILNYWGSLYYMFALRDGPAYVLASDERIFWFSTFADFIHNLAADYPLVLVLGILGTMTSGMGWFPLLSLGALGFVRSFSDLSSVYYPLVFLPGLSFFSYFVLNRLMSLFKMKAGRLLLAFSLLGAAAFPFVGLFSYYPFGMNRWNSNFDAFIRKLSFRFPEAGRIYQRDISLKPYLQDRRGVDLDAIEFRSYPEERSDFISELSQPGCKLIIAEVSHLGVVGITEDDLVSMNYSEYPYQLVDGSGEWTAYSKECNAWEYE
ncbi:MAG: hypothetical protein HND47_01695 [Chloroflexi bacterium]|nr:hypothetical protein [Chloroflexota bacterium]